MEKKVEEMMLDEAINCLEEILRVRGYSQEFEMGRDALYAHILSLLEGGEG